MRLAYLGSTSHINLLCKVPKPLRVWIDPGSIQKSGFLPSLTTLITLPETFSYTLEVASK